MVEMSPFISTLTGIPSKDCWSATVSQETNVGTLVCAMTFFGSNAQQRGKECQSAIEELAGHLTTPEQFVSFFQTLPLTDGELVAGLITLQESLFFTFGKAQAVLVRGNESHPIINEDVIQTTHSSFMRGEVSETDDVYLGTQSFFESLFTIVSTSLHPEKMLSSYPSDSQNTAANAGLCVALVQLKEPEVEEPTVPLPAIQTLPPSTISPPPLSHRPLQTRRIKVGFKRSKLVGALGVVIAFCIVIVLGNSLILGRRNARVESVIKPYSLRLEQAKGQSEKVAKIQALSALLTDLEQSRVQYASDRLISRRFDALFQSAKAEYEAVSAQKEIAKLSVFYDFRLVAADFVASSFAFDRPGKLAVCLDRTQNRLLSLSLENKAPQTLSIADKLTESTAVTVQNRKAYVVGTQGVIELSLPLDTMGKLVASAPTDWQPRLISAFGDNVYALDRKQRNIMRFDVTDPTSSPSAWIKDKEGINFDELSSLVVDGDVWVGTTQGTVLRFSRGEQIGFKLEQAVSLPTSTIALYTTETSTLLYILEPRGKRLLVYQKDGTYVASVISPDLETASSVIVDEETQTAYILAGSLIYSVSLQIPSS